MDTAHLKTFLEIYRVRHFGRAAERLCITQSAASARIKLLEEQLGVALFARNHGSVTPTAAGQRLLKYAEAVVTNWEQAVQNVALPDDHPQTIRIGCLPDIWHLYLQHRLPRLQAVLEQSALYLSIHPGKTLIEQVLQGTLEAGIAYEPVQTPLMTHQALPPFALTLLSTQPKQTLESALGDQYIMVDWGTSFQTEYRQQVSPSTQPLLHVNSGMLALDILRQRGGAAYLPAQAQQLAGQYSGQTKLYPVESAPVFKRVCYLAYRQETTHAKLIQALISALQT